MIEIVMLGTILGLIIGVFSILLLIYCRSIDKMFDRPKMTEEEMRHDDN